MNVIRPIRQDGWLMPTVFGDRFVTQIMGEFVQPGTMGRTEAPAHPAASKLTRAVRVETLQELQDRFAALGRMTVAIRGQSGAAITKPTWGSRFSSMIGDSPAGSVIFAECILKLLAGNTLQSSDTCLDGMSLYAAPIAHAGEVLAVIVVGTRTHAPPAADALADMAARYGLDAAELGREAALINPFRGGTPDAIHRFADAIAHMIATLYGQALRIERQLAVLTVIHRLSDLLAGTLDLQELLDVTVRRVVDAMPVKACAIRMLHEPSGELVLKAVYNLSEEYLRKGPVLLRGNAIDAMAFAGETVYIEDAPNDPRSRYPENARREGIVSGLSVPMTYRGQTVGVIRVYTGRKYKFDELEEALLRSIGSQAAAAIINSLLYDEQAKAARVQDQVERAGQIQRRMIPANPPRHRGLEFGCVYVPTIALGGDFYDFLDLPEGSLGVCIADVVGKGLPAALMMASIRASLRAVAHDTGDVSHALGQVNRHLHRDTRDNEFATMIFGAFDGQGGLFTYCNAGHPPPLLLRGDRFVELAAGGLVLGVHPGEVYGSETLALRGGDIIVMYTDGVTEAMGFAGAPFGRERLLGSVWRHRECDARHLASQLLWDVRRFVGLSEQSDDITVVVARVL